MRNRILLQLAVAIGGCVPVSAGGAGVLFGPHFLDTASTLNTDNHFRYLSGLLLGIGLCFWGLVPHIETQGVKFRTLAFVVFAGGCGRLFAIFAVGLPSPGMLAALSMELGVTPLLCLWQWRVSQNTTLR
jgi:hypothetical protein